MKIIKSASYLILSSLLASSLCAKEEGKKPVLYYADSQTYDRALGILILKGHVEFEHEGDVLEADYVTYNEETDIVTASGNVRLRSQTGDIEFADYVELTGDMKEGVALQLRALLADDAKVAALEGRKVCDQQELDHAVYTPCLLCGDKPPTWQINARRAVKDDVTKNIYFTDAEMRVLDIPILYIPYMTQPLERRSGFLIPSPRVSSTFGPATDVPMFVALSEDADFTFTPNFYAKQHPLFEGEYRQAFGNGFLSANGSIIDYMKSTKDKKNIEAGKYHLPQDRGHILANGQFNLSEVWRTSFSGGWVTDKTYFRRFGFPETQNNAYLLSKGIVEGFLNQRDYAAMKVYHFQGLRDDDRQKRLSTALPYLEYNAYSGLDPWGGRFNFDGNFLNIYRKEGINMQRGVGSVAWKRPWVTGSGQLFTLFGSARGDLYSVHQKLYKYVLGFEVPIKKDGGARFFPQGGLNWRWPFINTCFDQSFIFQPVVQLIAAPDKPVGLKSRLVPNEDSTDFEFNDANLFSPDRFPGYDIIDTGSRLVYGGEAIATGSFFGDIDIFLGQSYALSKPKRFEKDEGFGRRASDYVGRIEASPLSWLDVNYRFRLDQKSLKHRVAEVGGSLGPSIARLSGDYTFISKDVGTPSGKDFNQISLTLSSQFHKQWTISGSIRQNLQNKKDNGSTLEKSVTLSYLDDCFGLGFSVQRENYKTKDVVPSTVFLVSFWLKNLGDFNHKFSAGSDLDR